jgi:hypothetical protein
MKPTSISIIKSEEIPLLDEFIDEYGLKDITYGDAELTLVYRDALIYEVELQNDADFKPLLDALRQVPEELYIALNG